jgi:hypothetical protein
LGSYLARHRGVDIDVTLPGLAAVARELALQILGLAPVRTRPNSSKCLLMYRTDETLRKRRFVFKAENGTEHAVELLATGQQYVIDGEHPDGGAYTWNVQPNPWDLSAITAAQWDEFCRALAERLQRVAGCTIVKDGMGGALASTRAVASPESLLAPDPPGEIALTAVREWKERRGEKHDEHYPHDAFVELCAAFRGAVGDEADELYDQFRELCPGGRDVDGNTDKTYHSFGHVLLGWSRLCQITGYMPPDVDEDELPEAPWAIACRKMLARYVYCPDVNKFYDTETGSLIGESQFDRTNTAVALAGEKSLETAHNIFLNHRQARKVPAVTYRPGKPLIVQEEINGTVQEAVNLYRPSSLVPMRGADVTRWLNHGTMLFGPPGSPAHDHFLNYLAFIVQNPGVKINHAPVLLGRQGIGKDTELVPLMRGLGEHNCKMVKPETLLGQFTHFLEAQLIVV